MSEDVDRAEPADPDDPDEWVIRQQGLDGEDAQGQMTFDGGVVPEGGDR